MRLADQLAHLAVAPEIDRTALGPARLGLGQNMASVRAGAEYSFRLRDTYRGMPGVRVKIRVRSICGTHGAWCGFAAGMIDHHEGYVATHSGMVRGIAGVWSGLGLQ